MHDSCLWRPPTPSMLTVTYGLCNEWTHVSQCVFCHPPLSLTPTSYLSDYSTT